MKIFRGKNIVLGVTGSIAAYKAATIASQLCQSGANVYVAMTRAAMHFVGTLTFESLAHRPVVVDVLALGPDTEIEHVALAKRADLILIAPATANTIARLAHGIADEALTAIALDTHAPIVIAPAMESGMWENAATKENVQILKGRGVFFVEPESGPLASGARGIGRLADHREILGVVRGVLARSGSFAGRKVVITAGGTQEPIDPVRVVTNHSSGKMGFALAEEALERGATVSFITAAEFGVKPNGAQVIQVGSTEEMRSAVVQSASGADVLIMAAAPADYRPSEVSKSKIKKDQTDRFTLELVRNPDILESVAQLRAQGQDNGPRVVVGFAAETDNLIDNALRKVASKHLDFIVANPVPQTFGSEQIEASLIMANGSIIELEPITKERLAEIIFDRIEGLLK